MKIRNNTKKFHLLVEYNNIVRLKATMEEDYNDITKEMNQTEEKILALMGEGRHKIIKYTKKPDLPFSRVRITKSEYERVYPHWQTIANKFLTRVIAAVGRSKLISKEYKKCLTRRFTRIFYETMSEFETKRDERRIYITFD